MGKNLGSPANLPRIDELRIDRPVLLFAFGLSLVSTVLFGLVPAVHGSRLDVSGALKQGDSKATGTRVSARLRSALVVAEVALSVILLVAAGLLLRSFQALQHVDLGFTKERVLVADTVYAVRDGVTEDIRNRSQFYADVLDRLRAVPGVRAASGVAYLGMGREPRAPRDFFIQGRPEGRAGERPQAEHHAITADYFKTLEIPVRAGAKGSPEREFPRSLSLVLGQGLRLVAIGLVLGLAGALAVAQLLTDLLYEIGPWDVGTYLSTIVVLASAALLATLLPAIRAATISPVIVLQQE